MKIGDRVLLPEYYIDAHGCSPHGYIVDLLCDRDGNQHLFVEYLGRNQFYHKNWFGADEIEKLTMEQPEFDLDDIEFAEILMEEMKCRDR